MQLPKINSFQGETQKLVSAFLLVLVSFFCVLLIFGIKYEVNDDAIISGIASGALGGHSERLINVHILIGYFLQIFYSAVGGVNWYVLFQLAAVLSCFVLLTYLAIDKSSLFYGCILSGIFMILIGFDILMWFQYSKNAAVLAVTGIILVRLSFEESSRKKKIFFASYGALLAIFSSMLRFESFIAVGALSIPFLLRGLEKTKILKCGAVFGAIVLSSLALVMVDIASYQAHDAWNEYYTYNELREEISDYKITFTSVENAEQYSLNPNEYALIFNWNFYDPEVFPVERLEAVEEQMPTQELSQIVTGFAYRAAHFLYASPPFLLLGFLLLAFVFFAEHKKGLYFLMTFAMLGLLLLYLLYISRLPHRVEILLAFSTAVFATLCFPFKKEIRPSKSLCGFALCAVLLLSGNHLEMQRQMQNDREVRESNMSYFDALSLDKENLYIVDTHLIDAMMGYNVFSTKPEDYFSNIVFLGSWHSRSPISSDKLAHYGHTNPYRALLDENTYYVANNYSHQEIHLQQNYDANAYMVEIPEQSTPLFCVFQVQTTSE